MSSEALSQLAGRIAELGRQAHHRGWVLGTSGNFSAVLSREPLRLAITASGADKGRLEPAQVLEIDGDGPIKTFPLRGVKESPPYLNDGRLLTLDDTVEFFNLVLGTRLTTEEKRDLTAFLRVL